MRERVRRLAEARRRSPRRVMREAVAPHLAREEERERLRQDGPVAWAEYQATGPHATEEEVDAWLARLEAGEEDAEPPACHPRLIRAPRAPRDLARLHGSVAPKDPRPRGRRCGPPARA